MKRLRFKTLGLFGLLLLNSCLKRETRILDSFSTIEKSISNSNDINEETTYEDDETSYTEEVESHATNNNNNETDSENEDTTASSAFEINESDGFEIDDFSEYEEDPVFLNIHSSSSSSSLSSVTTASSSSASSVNTTVTCKSPRKYTYTLPAVTYVNCDSHQSIFKVQIPDTGRAVAVFNGRVFNYQASGDAYAIHSWSGYADVGTATFADKINFGSGEAVCAQQYGNIQLMGYGELSSSSQTVKINLLQYVSSGCGQALAVMPGATLTVWVEDSKAECVEKSIVAKSYFRNVWKTYGSGTQKISYPGTTVTNVLSSAMNVEKNKKVSIYSQVQTSIDSTTNVCGGQYETAGAYLSTAGAHTSATVFQNVVPVSAGITHGAYYPQISFNAQSSGTLSATLSAYVNQTANAGGRAKVGETYSGDTVLVFIQE